MIVLDLGQETRGAVAVPTTGGAADLGREAAPYAAHSSSGREDVWLERSSGSPAHIGNMTPPSSYSTDIFNTCGVMEAVSLDPGHSFIVEPPPPPPAPPSQYIALPRPRKVVTQPLYAPPDVVMPRPVAAGDEEGRRTTLTVPAETLEDISAFLANTSNNSGSC